MDSPWSRRERRLILPGSPATIAASTAPAAGHLASPTGPGDGSAADASAAIV
jgi:hypothetical protein